MAIGKLPERARDRHVRRRLAGPLLLSAGLFLAVPVLAGFGAASAGEYRLGPEDQIRVKVYEWRPSQDTIVPWTALNDTFTVGPDGWLSLPLAGRIEAGGRSSSEVEQSIDKGLQKNMGLARTPNAAVEIVKFRPIYVVGNVIKGGSFPYQPGLTVLQAISLAGGLPNASTDFARFQREIIQSEGDISVLKATRITLLARASRLKAEMSGAKSIDFDAALKAHSDDPVVKTAMQQETMIFRARKDGMETQVAALESLSSYLDQETSSLGQQLGYLDKQIASIQKELGNVSSLVKKGLAAAPRQFELERSLAQTQSQRLAAETSLLQAKQEISKSKISVIELKDGRRNEVAASLRQTQADLEENARKQGTSKLLLQDSAVTAPKLLARQHSQQAVAPNYTIFRRSADGKMTEISAEETSPVRPGDTVKVEIPLSQDDGIGPSSFDPAGILGGSSAIDEGAKGGSPAADRTAMK